MPMRRFMIYCFMFSVAVVATLLLGEYVVSTHENSYKYKHRRMVDNASAVQCVVLGSSHSYYGFKADDFIPGTFNLANVSQNYEYDNLLLRNYAPRCANLHMVVVPVSYCSFFDTRFEDCDDWWYAINYKKYMDVNVHSDFSMYNFELSNMPVFSGRLMNILKGEGLPMCDSLGFGLGYNVENRSPSWERDAHIAVERHTADSWDAYEENVTQLRNILSYCRDNSLKAVLVTLPTWHLYHDSLDNRQLQKMYETIKALRQEFDVDYYDFLCDKRFVMDDFYDCDHLSNVGAEKFTIIFRNSLNF